MRVIVWPRALGTSWLAKPKKGIILGQFAFRFKGGVQQGARKLQGCIMEVRLWQILVLAVVQGIAEFLPISSSGHVVILAELVAPGNSRGFDVTDVNIVLHLGTLLSILVFYWQRVVRLLGEDRRTIGLLVVGTIPAVAIGVPVHVCARELFESPLVAGTMLIVTGAILIWASRAPFGQGSYQRLSHARALAIGTAQAAAILPGLSRSGATISAALRLGLTPRAAATFSFLLAIPAIAGAGVLDVASMVIKREPGSTPAGYLILGATVSFLVGWASLWWLVRWLERGRLQWFAAWCIPVGILVVVWQLW